MAKRAEENKRKRYLVTMTLPHTCWAETEDEAKIKAKVYFLEQTQDKKDPAKKLNIRTEEIQE